MAITILLVDDHSIIREGISTMLKNKEEFNVVALAKNGREAIQLVRKHKPDIVVMDISMPGLNGIEATKIIKSEFKSVEVIALSAHYEKSYIVEMLKAGALGYLTKSCIFEELSEAIHAVSAGEVFLGSTVSDVVARDYISIISKAEETCESPLTSREREVLQLIAEGKKTRDIAEMLNVSVKTVETHRRRVMEKLNIFSVANLTRFAIREGLTSLETQLE